MKSKLRSFLALPLAAALLATGCTAAEDMGETNTTPLPAVDVNSRERDALATGGELRLAASAFGATLNPLAPNRNTQLDEVRRAVLPVLFRHDAQGVPQPNTSFLESATETADNPTTVTLKLNPNAKWADGGQFSANDVAATLTACTQAGYNCRTDLPLDQVESATATSNTEVELTFSSAEPGWRNMLAEIPMLRQDSVRDANTFNTGWAELPKAWSAGPFVADDWSAAADAIVAPANPIWWGEKPLLARLSVRKVQPENQASAYQRFQIDALRTAGRDAYATATQVPDTVIRRATSTTSRSLLFNLESTSPASDPAVRSAIARTLDRSQVGTVANPDLDFTAAPLNSNVFLNGEAGYVDNAAALEIERNLDTARKALDDAGWRRESDGARAKDGRRLELRLTRVSGNSVSELEANEIQRQLAAVGIVVTIEDVTAEQYGDGSALRGGQYDMIVVARNQTGSPYAGLAAAWQTDGAENYARFSNPEVDNLLEQIGTVSDQNQRQQLANQVDQQLWTILPQVPLYQTPELTATKSRLSGYGSNGLADVVWENVGTMV